MATIVTEETRTRGSRRSHWSALAGVFIACAQAAQASDLADVKARGKLVVVAFPTQDSLAVSANLDVLREQGLKLSDLRRPEQFRGFDVELLKGFADSLGVQLEIHAVTTGVSDLLRALARHACDLLAGGLGITPKRLELADFSQPYVSSWLAVVVRRDSTISSLADLAGKTGAVISASTPLELLQAAAPKAKVVLTSFNAEALELIDSGKADFTIEPTDLGPGQPISSAAPNLKVAFRLRQASVGFAARKGSDLLPPLDAYLEKLRKSGELDRLLQRNGVPPARTPTPP